MRLWILSLALIGGLALTACDRLAGLGDPLSTTSDATTFASVARIAPTLNNGDVVDARIRVHFRNLSKLTGSATVTMRTAGEQTRFARRTILGESSDVVIGPDRTDSVTVEIALNSKPARSLPQRVLRLGADFKNGDVIEIVIPLQPEDDTGQDIPGNDNNSNDNNANGNTNDNNGNDNNSNDNGTPDVLAVALLGLDDHRRVNIGDEVDFSVAVSGFAADVRVNVLADGDAVDNNGNEVEVASDLAAAAELPILWVVPELAPGAYRIVARAAGEAGEAKTQTDVGAILVNSKPTLLLDAPLDGLLVTRGRVFTIGWAGQDDDDDAVIRLFIDVDGELNGNEIPLRDNISEDAEEDNSLVVDTSDLPIGDYRVGGVISDPLTDVVQYGGRVCITNRLVGRHTPASLLAGEFVTIVAGAANQSLGTAIDIGSDVDGDGKADVLISDLLSDSTGRPSTASVYYHEQAGDWPATFDIADARLRIVQEASNSQTGARLALLPSIDGDGYGEMLIGAPLLESGGYAAGRAYVLNGRAVRNRGLLDLAEVASPLGTYLDGTDYEQAGLDVAGVGDVDGDGVQDYAVGSIGLDGAGGVTVIRGGAIPQEGYLGQRGTRIFGSRYGSALGWAIRRVPDVNASSQDEFVIGAPGDGLVRGGSTGPGIVYFVWGHGGLFTDFPQGFSVGNLGDNPPGRLFVGENDGDLAGYALAVGDVDDDGLIDLVIGAPGYDGARGRVYLVSNAGNPELPFIVSLADVGGAVSGAVFEGLSGGDQFGAALGVLHDFDGDGKRDLAAGSPGAESGRGVLRLVYGEKKLSGAPDLARLGTCDLPGLELVGQNALDALGLSISGGDGDVNGDGRSDLAVGAPGFNATGRAYVVFGKAGDE
ncbi:FG-GAP repeat protein [Phycisphaerae bacterium RAS1]|nr:FG-GAP repeat protein [Phycisphaerae bacterium RAS1]